MVDVVLCYAMLHAVYCLPPSVCLYASCVCVCSCECAKRRLKKNSEGEKEEKINDHTEERDDDGSANRSVMGYSGQAINLAHRTFYQPVNINPFACIVAAASAAAAQTVLFFAKHFDHSSTVSGYFRWFFAWFECVNRVQIPTGNYLLLILFLFLRGKFKLLIFFSWATNGLACYVKESSQFLLCVRVLKITVLLLL